MRAASKQRVSHWGNQFIFHGEQLIMIDGDGQAYLKPVWVRDCIIHERKHVYLRCGTGSSGCLQISAALQRRRSVGRIKTEESIVGNSFSPACIYMHSDVAHKASRTFRRSHYWACRERPRASGLTDTGNDFSLTHWKCLWSHPFAFFKYIRAVDLMS